MRRELLVIAALIAALALGGVGGILGWQWYQGLGGERRPAFSLPDLDGERRRISEWDGEILVINFWATWCRPCREEVPLLRDIQRDLGDAGVQVIGVAVDRLQPVQRFVAEYDVNYPVLQGLQAAMDVQARYGNQAGTLPYTVIVGRDGKLRHLFQRRIHAGELRPILQNMLADSR